MLGQTRKKVQTDNAAEVEYAKGCAKLQPVRTRNGASEQSQRISA